MNGNVHVRFLGEGWRGNTYPLPDHMRDADELKEALHGQHLIQTDACEVIANVTEVMVMPQAYGAICVPSNGVSDCV